MTTYRIEMMTARDYNEYMMGGYNFVVEKADIKAETAEKAILIAKAMNPNMIINENNVRTIVELNDEEDKRKAFVKAEEEKRAAAKAKKEAREKEKAEAAGLTLEEYRAKIKHERKVREAVKEIEELERALAKAKAKLAKLEK